MDNVHTKQNRIFNRKCLNTSVVPKGRQTEFDSRHPDKIMEEKDIESLLYSYDEWKAVYKKMPYSFTIKKNAQYLYYFGANHSHDPKNEEFPALREFWKEFLEKAGNKNGVVFVEGGLRKLVESEETAIKRDSESGFITFLANRARVPVHCPEPNPTGERINLLKKFSKEEVQYYYFARVAHAWHRRDPKPNFEEYTSHYLEQDKVDSKWEDFDFSLEHMKLIHKKLFGTDFENNEQFSFQNINPTVENSVINKVARACSIYRNVHIVTEILKFWKEGKNIFVVFGGAHAVLQEPALRKLL